MEINLKNPIINGLAAKYGIVAGVNITAGVFKIQMYLRYEV